MSESQAYAHDRPELSIVPDEVLAVAWETRTVMPTSNTDAAWQWMKHMGLVGLEEDGGENGAGWGIPSRYSRRMPTTLQSPATLDGTRTLEVGTRARDVPKDAYAEVVAIDDQAKSILWKSDWPADPKAPGEEPLLYTYRISLEPDPKGTAIKTEMRATNVKHPHVLQKLGPGLDSRVMKLFAEGLTEAIDPAQAVVAQKARTRRHVGYAAAIGVGVVGWRLLRRSKG